MALRICPATSTALICLASQLIVTRRMMMLADTGLMIRSKLISGETSLQGVFDMKSVRKIQYMWMRFGNVNDHKCKECCHFTRFRYHDYKYYKCKVYGDTASQATDWSGRNIACGMFNKPYDGVEIIEILKRSPRIEQVSDNQGRLF